MNKEQYDKIKGEYGVLYKEDWVNAMKALKFWDPMIHGIRIISSGTFRYYTFEEALKACEGG